MNSNDIKKLAIEGLRSRIAEAKAELLKLDIQLADLVGAGTAVKPRKKGSKSGLPKNPNRKMSTANKKQISARMKDYWAKRRATKPQEEQDDLLAQAEPEQAEPANET